MKIHFVASEDDPGKARIEFQCEDDNDILAVKRLPGWFYFAKKNVWVVPISIGLAMALEQSEKFLGSALLALVQEQEKTLLYSLTAPAPQMTIAQMDRITTDIAIRNAFVNHAMTIHQGRENEYIAIHPEVLTAPDIKPAKRRRKTEREIKDKQIQKGRLD